MLNITALLFWCVVSLFSELCIRGMYVFQNVLKEQQKLAVLFIDNFFWNVLS